MSSLADFFYYFLILFTGTLFVVVFYQLLTGRINTAGMLRDKTNGQISPGRIQKLFFSLTIGLYYLVLTYKNPQQFPDVPTEMLIVLGGSSSLYLAGKAQSVFNFFKPKSPTP